MAYVTLEDDTASIEMLLFAKAMSACGSYLAENAPVVVVGNLSLRDDKEPQLIVKNARPMSDYSKAPKVATPPSQGTLYLRLDTEDDVVFPKVRAIINMFPGDKQVVVYFADTKQRRGAKCDIDPRMLEELKNLLGEENVIVK